MQQQLARLAAVFHIRENRNRLSVPIVSIVGRELEVPFEFTGSRIEREHGAGVEIVAFARLAIFVGPWVAGGPIDQIQLGVVSAAHPGGATAVFKRKIAPGFGAGLPSRGNGPESPKLFASFCGKRGHVSSHTAVSA